jgi:hypothetical protein
LFIHLFVSMPTFWVFALSNISLTAMKSSSELRRRIEEPLPYFKIRAFLRAIHCLMSPNLSSYSSSDDTKSSVSSSNAFVFSSSSSSSSSSSEELDDEEESSSSSSRATEKKLNIYIIDILKVK